MDVATSLANAALAAVLALVALVVPPSTPPQPVPPPPPAPLASPTPPRQPVAPFSRDDSVWVVGDSLAVGASDPFAAAAPFRVETRAVVGVSIGNRIPAIAEARSAGADAIVIQAGTNDIADGRVRRARWRRDISAALDAAAGVRCVVWVDVRTDYAGGYELIEPAAPAFNETLRQVAADRPGVRILSMDRVFGLGVPPDAADGLHLTGRGYRVLATGYLWALRGCPPV